MRAAIYTRISQDRHGDQLGVRRQERDCRDLAARYGWKVAEVYVDDDRSAYSGKPRPGYQAMLTAVKNGEIDAILAWHPDRLHRSPRELEDFIDLLDASGCRVATVQAGEIDLATPAGRMTARVVGAVARHESEHKSARIRAKQAELAEAGKLSGGGTRPFGYEPDRLTIRESEAEVIREVARRLLAGEAIRGVIADLTARGITPVGGQRWRTTSVRRIMLSPRIAGLRSLRGRTFPAVWPAIIDADTHLRLVALLTDPARRMGTGSRSYLLTGGLAVCGRCGAKLVARPRGDGRRAYVCAKGVDFDGCGRLGALAATLEAEVVARLLDRVNAPLPTVERDHRGGVEVEIQQIEERRAQLATDHYADRLIDRTQFLAASAALDERVAALRRRLVRDVTEAQHDAVRADSDRLAQRWPDMPFDRQRAVLSAWIDKVIVMPAVKGRNFFDPARVQISWR